MLANRLIGLKRLGTYAEEITADSPVAWWRLDETSGTTAADAIGSNDGTYAGATLDQSPLINAGRSVLFSGSGSGITIPDAANLSFVSTAFAIELWAKTSASSQSQLVVKNSSTEWPEYWLYMLANGKVKCEVRPANGGSPAVTAVTAVAINNGTQHHVVSVFVPSSTLKIYIDGIERASVSHSIATSYNSSSKLFIGRRNEAYEYWAGALDEIALYGAELSAARIIAHYNAGI